MRIFIIGRRLWRFLVITLIIIFILPLLYHFLASAVDPTLVHFREPLGEAVKVLMPEGAEGEQIGFLGRVFYYIRVFYQNKL